MSKLLYDHIKKRSYVMKYLNKLMVFFLFMLFSYGVDTSAYTYSFANMSGRDVRMELHWVFGKLDKKGKNDKLIKKYETHKFHLGGWETGLCLTKIIALSYDPEKKHLIELPVPIKIVDRKSFDRTKTAIGQFNKAVKEIGKGAALVGPKGKILSGVISGVADLASILPEIWAVSLCRSRDFILVLDYDELLKIDKIYALTPPE